MKKTNMEITVKKVEKKRNKMMLSMTLKSKMRTKQTKMIRMDTMMRTVIGLKRATMMMRETGSNRATMM